MTDERWAYMEIEETYLHTVCSEKGGRFKRKRGEQNAYETEV